MRDRTGRQAHREETEKSDGLTDADPFRLFDVNPCRIEWRERETSRRWGRLEDRNWDTRTSRVDETIKRRSISVHVEDDVP